jgi:aspartate kinase
VAAKLFDIPSKGGLNIQMISTSEIKIAVILDEDRIADAAKAVHAGCRLAG